MNPNFKKKKPLPYKNLGELYIETAYHEPSISRLVSVLLEDGKVAVISQDTSDPGAPAQDYEVDKEYFNNEIIPRLELGRPDRITVRTKIEDRLKKIPSRDLEKTTDIYQKFIERLGIVLDDDKDFASNFGDKLIGNNTVQGNFSDLLKTTYNLEKKPSDPDNPDSPGPALWYSVFNAMPHIVRKGGRGTPGEGELFISFFSDTKRPTTGDVEIKGVKIEIKGVGGRLYKAVVAEDKLPSAEEFNGSSTLGVSGYNETNKVNIITDFIINLAGGGDGRSGTHNNQDEIKIIVTKNLAELEVDIYARFVTIKAAPLLTRIIGAQQLLLYKKETNFNNFLIFNKYIELPNIPYIVFYVPDTLQGILSIFATNDISIERNSDGGGHQIVWPVTVK